MMDTLIKVYLKWEGRISRKTYWIYSIPLALIFLLADIFIAPYHENIALLIILLVLYPGIMINIKRSHDRGRSGWFVILLGIPIVSLWPLIEFGFIKGSDSINKYGEPDNIWGT